MTETRAMTLQTIFIVDDEIAIRDWLERLLSRSGYRVESYASADAFLRNADLKKSGCIILDVQMPGMDGPTLQNHLRSMGIETPVLFLTGHGQVSTATNAMLAGAVNFLEKPVRESVLLESVARALEQDAATRQRTAATRQLNHLLNRLAPRERQVMELLVQGKPAKAIAYELGTTNDTVRKQRASVLRKMEVDSVPDLIRTVMSTRLHTDPTPTTPLPATQSESAPASAEDAHAANHSS